MENIPAEFWWIALLCNFIWPALLGAAAAIWAFSTGKIFPSLFKSQEERRLHQRADQGIALEWAGRAIQWSRDDVGAIGKEISELGKVIQKLGEQAEGLELSVVERITHIGAVVEHRGDILAIHSQNVSELVERFNDVDDKLSDIISIVTNGVVRDGKIDLSNNEERKSGNEQQ